MSTRSILLRGLRRAAPVALSFATLAAVGCSGGEAAEPYDFSSDQATLLEFEFDGELIVGYAWNPESLIEDQMLYTIGHLNGEHAVGRLDKLEITNVERTELDSGDTHIKYHAKLPVGWGSKTNLPETYELTLPLNVDSSDYQKFTEKYSHSCVDWGAHDVDTGSMWYYYRPKRYGCELDAADVFKTTATVTVSDENTTGKYPEYHKVWEDDALKVVAIFGKYEDGATSGDSGIDAYDTFVSETKRLLRDYGWSSEPAEIPEDPGVAMPDVTIRSSLPDGRTVEIVALLVDNVRTAGVQFNQRYEALSGDADMIAYNGHAGLGANIRALADKGKFKTGQYQLFFMNGCDTFAYVDSKLADAHAAINDDDTVGTRYLDMVTNVMPSFFSSMPYASMALIKGLMSYDAPKTFEGIFKDIDRSEVVVVTGEEDNVFEPGYQPGGNGWAGIEESGSLGQGESKVTDLGTLAAGSYVFSTSAGPDGADGDVDLYLALGRTPTLTDYDERPYLNGSDESITITLDAPTQVVLMVHGYEYSASETSSYVLKGQVAE